MKFAAALLALAASASAQYSNKTDAFNLLVKGTDNATIDGYLYACHTGAAIEALCYTAGAPSASHGFYFNYSDSVPEPSPGFISWLLTYNGGEVSEPLSLSYNPVSNVAPLQLLPSTEYQLVAFDSDKLVISAYVDDEANGWGTRPDLGANKLYNNWAVCWSYVGGGYYYQVAAWILGDQPAHNPTCVSVDITRAFI